MQEGRRQGRAPPWWARSHQADNSRRLGAPGVCGARLRWKVPEERGQGHCLWVWDSKELGALRWEPPQGKASSDCPAGRAVDAGQTALLLLLHTLG